MEKAYGSIMEVARIQSEINRLFDNLLDLGAGDKTGGAWIPNADIFENEESLIVEVELPGVSPEALSLSVHSGNVVIAGDRQQQDEERGLEVQIAERSFGTFRRVIHLGVPVNTRQAVAVLKSGLLRICFPKVPNRRGEAVPIEVEVE
jgi:HSP20 family protein